MTILSNPGAINEGSRATPGLWNRIIDAQYANSVTLENYINTQNATLNTSISGVSTRLTGWNIGSVTTQIKSTSAASFANTLTAPINDRGGQVYNVRAYGAVADDSTNDQPAIQAAIDAAAAAGGGVVFFPQGVYRLNATLDLTLTDNVELQGVGQRINNVTTAGSVLKRYFAGTMVDATGTAGGTHTNGLRIYSLTFDGNKSATSSYQGTAVDLTATSGAVLRDVEFVYNNGHALKLAETWDATCDNVWVRSCGNAESSGIYRGDAAILITDTSAGATNRADFYSLHCESNVTCHLQMTQSSNNTAEWVRFYGAKFHDAQSVVYQIKVPLVKMDAARYPALIGAYFSNSSNVEQLRYAGDMGLLDLIMIEAGGATTYPLNVTGGSRSIIRAIINASVNTASRISGGNHRVTIVANGITNSATTTFGNNVVTEERDTVYRFHNGKIDFRNPGSDSTQNPTTDTPVDWFEVQIAGTTRRVPVYI